MSMPNIYRYFNERGQRIARGSSDYRTMFAPFLRDQILDEGLAALFMLASAVEEGKFFKDIAQTVTRVDVNGDECTVDELAAHAKSGTARIGQPVYVFPSEYDAAYRTIASVFPQFER